MDKLFIDARPNYETFKIFGTLLYSINIYIVMILFSNMWLRMIK